MAKTKPARTKTAAPVVPLPPVHEIVLMAYGAADDGGVVVTLPAPTLDRLYSADGVQYEYVGHDAAGRRVYRNQTRT